MYSTIQVLVVSVKTFAFCCSSVLYRNAPTAQQTQREARQATFLSRRGLKVHAQVQKTSFAQPTQRTRSWRTPTNNSGILTVSIDNPTARTQPEPAQSWSLHPETPARSSPAQEEPERKPPKGVALQFDINSVGKQTGMTLNERFRILKDQRVAAEQQSSKGGRFVTVA
ncbi:UAP56-interacting factor-like [Sinocyclocheilus grahami]|uniref:UAP56-interacting factor-like n=1 Tax=Sinocyclocheilus grahami TaxID=75366 RepID=UPI0007AD0169|nr:PREDICTED: UAP56-interacting factor-like [Sinocyclocheilus grahami]